jgi:uncharacterized protein (DUF362 family)
MTRVSITAVGDDVAAAFAQALERADCEGAVFPGARVLIKPNWNGVNLPSSTSLDVVMAACQWARSRGAGEVIVGEGPVPVGPERLRAYFRELDADRRLSAVGARFVNFDEDEHVLFRGAKDWPEETGVARLALESDVIINVPLMKVHSCCLATLCVKNLKGCLRPQDKMAFHRVGLLPAIVALNRLIRPQINVIDALQAMEGDHSHGPLVPLGLLIAGRDPVAVDAVGCAQMGLDPEKVPLLRMASQAGLGVHRREEIELTGEPLEPRKFELVQERLARHYPDLDLHEDGACSACRAALMDGLYIAGGQRTAQVVALGPQAQPPPGALVLGQCLRDYWPTHAHVKGCPPSGHEVAQALQGGSAGERT